MHHMCLKETLSVLHLPYSLDCTATWPSAISLHRVQRPWRKTLEYCTYWNQFLGTVKIAPLHFPWSWRLSSCWSGDFLPAHVVRGQVLGYQEGLRPFLDGYRGISQIPTQYLDHSMVATKLDTCPNGPWPSKAHTWIHTCMSRSTSYTARWLPLTWAGVYTRSVCWQRNTLAGTHHANTWRDMIS